MIPLFKCWLFGHKWKLQGHTTVHYLRGDEHLKSTQQFLFFCPRCHGFKEYETKCAYSAIPKHEESEVEIESDE